MGDRLREERSRLSLNQEDLSQAGGVNRNTQGSYERGTRNPDTAYLEGIASLGIDIVYVLSGQRTLNAALSAEEVRIVEMFRSVPSEDRVTMLRVLKAFADDAARTQK